LEWSGSARWLALDEMRLCGYKVVLFAWRSLHITRTMYVERCISLLTYVEHLLCQLIEARDLSENSVDEVKDVKSEAGQQVFFQRIVYLLPMLGCVCEAARVEGPRRLLE